MDKEQIAVRLPTRDLEALDALVARGVYPSRAAAVRAGVAALTRTVRGIPTELVLTPDDGLPVESAATFDNLRVVPKAYLIDRISQPRWARPGETARAPAMACSYDRSWVGVHGDAERAACGGSGVRRPHA